MVLFFNTEAGTSPEISPPLRNTSLTILEEMNEVLRQLVKTVSIFDKVRLVCAIAFSNSKSAGFLRPRKINFACSFWHKSMVKPV